MVGNMENIFTYEKLSHNEMLAAYKERGSFSVELTPKQGKVLELLLNNINDIRRCKSSNASVGSRFKLILTSLLGMLLTVRVYFFYPQLFHVLGFYAEAQPYYLKQESSGSKTNYLFSKSK